MSALVKTSEELRQKMTDKGLNQKGLAKLAGVSVSAVCAAMNRTKNPKRHSPAVDKIKAVLHNGDGASISSDAQPREQIDLLVSPSASHPPVRMTKRDDPRNLGKEEKRYCVFDAKEMRLVRWL